MSLYMFKVTCVEECQIPQREIRGWTRCNGCLPVGGIVESWPHATIRPIATRCGVPDPRAHPKSGSSPHALPLRLLVLALAVARVHPSADHESLFGRRCTFDPPGALQEFLADSGGALRGEGFLRGGGVWIDRIEIHLAALYVHRHILDDDCAVDWPELRGVDENMLTLERRGAGFDPG